MKLKQKLFYPLVIIVAYMFFAAQTILGVASITDPTLTQSTAVFTAQSAFLNDKIVVTNTNPGRGSSPQQISNIGTAVQTYVITFLPAGSPESSNQSGRAFSLIALPGDDLKIELERDTGAVDFTRTFKVPGAGNVGTGNEPLAGLGQSCDDVLCADGFVCHFSGKARNTRICKGILDTTGCASGTGINGETGDILCAAGLICNALINKCVNDFGGEKAEKLKLGQGTTDIRNELTRIINIFLSFLAIIGVIIVLYGGILWGTAGGNDERIQKARRTMISGAIGLALIGVAWTIVSYVINISDTIS